MAPEVDVVVAITFFGKPDPDDPRDAREQALEQVECVAAMLEDVGADVEVVSIMWATEREECGR